jgi:hypothetical protein
MTVADGWEIPADGLQMRTFADKASDQATHCALGDSPAPGIGTVRVRRSSSAVERVMLSLDRTGSLRALDRDDPGLGAHVRADAPCAPAGSLAMIGVDGEFRLPAGWCLPRPFAAAVPPGASIATEIHAAGRGTPMSGAVRIDFEPAAGSAEPRRVAESFCAGPLGAIREERTGTTTRTDSGALVRDVQVGVIGLRTDERCTAVRVTAIAPGGAERVLLDIPKYREALDRAYRFEPPVALVCGTLLRIDTVHADENAVMRSQPMAILWCAAAEGSVFPPRAQQPVERVQAMDAAAVPGASAAEGITWFDAVAACNERSAREGLPPAYRIEHMERVDGRIVRAQVTRTPSAGWRLPRAADIAAEPAAPADAWWWTDDESGLSGFTIVSPRNGQRDSVPPSVRIPGLWSGMTRPAVAPSAKEGHDPGNPRHEERNHHARPRACMRRHRRRRAADRHAVEDEHHRRHRLRRHRRRRNAGAVLRHQRVRDVPGDPQLLDRPVAGQPQHADRAGMGLQAPAQPGAEHRRADHGGPRARRRAARRHRHLQLARRDELQQPGGLEPDRLVLRAHQLRFLQRPSFARP